MTDDIPVLDADEVYPPEVDDLDDDYDPTEPLYDPDLDDEEPVLPPVPEPIDWWSLQWTDAEQRWIELDLWVNAFRKRYSVPAGIIPPTWHTHPELVDTLSALHLHRLTSYDREQGGSGPIAFMQLWWEVREQLRRIVNETGAGLKHDRAGRIYPWPGEPAAPEVRDETITDREAHFRAFVAHDVAIRRVVEQVERQMRRDLGL